MIALSGVNGENCFEAKSIVRKTKEKWTNIQVCNIVTIRDPLKTRREREGDKERCWEKRANNQIGQQKKKPTRDKKWSL